MKYQPKNLDPNASDVSRGNDKHPLGELALLVGGLAVIAAAVFVLLALVAYRASAERLQGSGPESSPLAKVLGNVSPATTNSPAVALPKTNGAHTYYLGAITRGPTNRKQIALCFTAHEYAESAEAILKTLRHHGGKASFFLTGVFLANTNYAPLIQKFMREGHYVGPHSDQHLLYCGWEKSRPTLVTKEEFNQDLSRNLEKIVRHRSAASLRSGPESVRFFLPPFEHYNKEIAGWTSDRNIVLMNFTPGTRSNADYTGEADKNFVSSDTIYKSIVDLEARDPNGMNGFILLLHLGAGPGRTDKFPTRFPELLDYLASKGYEFVTVETLLN